MHSKLQITASVDAAGSEVWQYSHEGRRGIACVGESSQGLSLYRLDLEGGDPRATPLTTGTNLGHPSWSPNGQMIAFEAEFGGEGEIAVLDLGNGAVKRVTHRSGNEAFPAWSPDGRSLAFAADRLGNSDIWILNLDTGQLRRLTTHPGFDCAPNFVPFEPEGEFLAE